MRQPLQFPFERARVRDTQDAVEVKVMKDFGGKISGKKVKIRGGKSEEWLLTDTDYLRRKFHTSDLSKIAERLNQELRLHQDFDAIEPLVPIPSMERDRASALRGRARREMRRCGIVASDTVKVTGVLEAEPEDGTDYSATRRAITLALLKAETDNGDRLFEKVRGFKLSEDKAEVVVTLKTNKKAFRTRGDGIGLEESLLSVLDMIQDQVIPEARENAKKLQGDKPKEKDSDGAISLSYLLDMEIEE